MANNAANSIAAAAPAQPVKREQAKSMTRIAIEQLFDHRLAVISLGVILLFCAVALGADLIAMAVLSMVSAIQCRATSTPTSTSI